MKKIEGDRRIRVDPDQRCGLRVFRDRADADAEIGAIHEEFERHHQQHGDGEDRELLVGHDRTEDFHHAAREERGIDLRPAAGEQHDRILNDHGHSERRQHGSEAGRAPQRPIGDDLDAYPDETDDHEGQEADDHGRRRMSCDAEQAGEERDPETRPT